VLTLLVREVLVNVVLLVSLNEVILVLLVWLEVVAEELLDPVAVLTLLVWEVLDNVVLLVSLSVVALVLLVLLAVVVETLLV